MNIITVGRDHLLKGGTEKSRILFERVSQKIHLDLPAVYDTSMFKLFLVPNPPYTVWIDEEGIIRALTVGSEVTKANLKAMLNGEIQKLPETLNSRALAKRDSIFDYRKPFLVNQNGGNDSAFLYRSLLSQWTPDMEQLLPVFTGELLLNSHLKGFQMFGATLNMLYSTAYFGTSGFYPGDQYYGNYWLDPILETTDTNAFSANFTTGDHIYCYSLLVPKEKENQLFLQQIMRDDLKRYFGFSVKTETRMMPCWYLSKISTNKKIQPKSDSSSSTNIHGNLDAAGFNFRNSSIQDVISRIAKYQDNIPIIDHTGISGNIDMDLNAMLSDIHELRKALQSNGFDLIKGKKEMHVIVIGDN